MDESSRSIFVSVKSNVIGIEDDTSFDLSILSSINSAIATLEDNGVGNKNFCIHDPSDPSTWINFVGETDDKNIISMVIFYVQNKTRLLFDPPTNATLLNALVSQLDEMLWRIKSRIEDE